MTTQEIIEVIKGLSVLELNDLVKACEEEFGVSAAAGVVVAAGAGAGAARRDSLCGRHRLPEENSLRQPAPAGGGDLRGGHRLCTYAGGYGHQGGDAGGAGGIHCRGNDPRAGHPP